MLWFLLQPATTPVLISDPFLLARCLIAESPAPQPIAMTVARGPREEGAGLRGCVSENMLENNGGKCASGKQSLGSAHVEALPDWLDLF